MKPRRTVLLYCADEVERSVLGMEIDLWGYRVERTCDLDDAATRVAGARFDLVLFALSKQENGLPLSWLYEPVIAQQKACAGRLLIFDRSRTVPWTLPCDLVPRVGGPALYLREAIAQGVARKRGPKKRMPWGPLCPAATTPYPTPEQQRAVAA